MDQLPKHNKHLGEENTEVIFVILVLAMDS